MDHTDSALARFMHSYERNSIAGDFSALVSQFAEVFLVAGPNGIQCIRSEDFASALPKRKQLFDRVGCQSTELIELKESWLGARYALASTRWRFIFRSTEGQPTPVEVDSTFLIDAGMERFRIVLYLPHQDLMEVLRRQGITGGC
jgi:hypothetical protein